MAPLLVLVTGASGAIGPIVVEELLTSGYAVRTFVRRRPGLTFSGAVEDYVGDLADRAAVADAMAGVSAVVHLAARLHFAGAPSRDLAAYRRVNVEGTANIVSAAEQQGASRVVLASTIAVYGSSVHQRVTESSPVNPDTPYAMTKLEAEEIVRRSHGRDGVAIGTVLRLAAVYGSRMKGNYRTLVRALAARRFMPIGDGRNLRTLVHERDAALAIVHALQASAAAGCTYNVTDGEVHTTDDIVRAICVALGRPAPRWHVPEQLAMATAAVLDELHRATLRGPGALRDRLQRYVENVSVDGAAIQRELNFAPRYSLQRGWQRVIDEMRTGGELPGQFKPG